MNFPHSPDSVSPSCDLTLVVPAFQEAQRIDGSLVELADHLRRHDYGIVEVIVVVATSTDGTASLARAHSYAFDDLHVHEVAPRVGKGRDVRAGMLEARGRLRMFMDADMATPLHHIASVKQRLETGSEVVIGTRTLPDIHNGWRRSVSELGNLAVRGLLLPRISDSQCGFKGFSARAALEIFGRQTILGWGFDMEILTIARELGFEIDELPIYDWIDRPGSTMDGKVTTAALATLADLLRIYRRRAIGAYRRPLAEPLRRERDRVSELAPHLGRAAETP